MHWCIHNSTEKTGRQGCVLLTADVCEKKFQISSDEAIETAKLLALKEGLLVCQTIASGLFQ